NCVRELRFENTRRPLDSPARRRPQTHTIPTDAGCGDYATDIARWTLDRLWPRRRRLLRWSDQRTELSESRNKVPGIYTAWESSTMARRRQGAVLRGHWNDLFGQRLVQRRRPDIRYAPGAFRF